MRKNAPPPWEGAQKTAAAKAKSARARCRKLALEGKAKQFRGATIT